MNAEGLRPESYLGEGGETLVATLHPDETLNSSTPNVMYGGHIASLIDCHSVWAAITFVYRTEKRSLGSEPQTAYVTGRLNVDYHKPTPLDQPIQIRAWVDGDVPRKTTVRSELGPKGTTTATGEVVTIRVDPSVVAGHHQAHSWAPSDTATGGEETSE